MHDGSTLRFSRLFGSGKVSAGGTTNGYIRSDILVNLLGGSSLLQGDLLRFMISKDD